jgi:hypothetical protein
MQEIITIWREAFKSQGAHEKKALEKLEEEDEKRTVKTR